ncbi:hypothetical protein [Hydrogenophaga crocea]|jgi:hypothetical protein|uniref:Uncharacterized protein n=1 Tax=Hydrogenophaga crocea TaxID=2716225 RepID=A0A6G8IJC7_9BURK|nr:hypothetical protein [Hydrogenophaga crocea]QIM53219.1 hypothetical protein G9Q37_14185 [Hydrogenophaga crocea]
MTTDARKTLSAIQALISKDLVETSAEQIRAEFVEDGLNPDRVAREMAEAIDAAVSEFQRSRVAATKAVKKATKVPVPTSRPALERIKELVQSAFQREPNLATAFRNGSKQSENDWNSTYDDLVLLGKIDPNQHD